MRGSIFLHILLLVKVLQISSFCQDPALEADPTPHLLWPFPASYSSGDVDIMIDDPCKFVFNVNNGSTQLTQGIQEVFDAYKRYMFASADCLIDLNQLNRDFVGASNNVLNFEIKDISKVQMDLDVDESYTLMIKTERLVISAQTYVGALRGLETFSQIISERQDPNTGAIAFVITSTPINITDSPRFVHRGLMVDTSRHFISKGNIFKILDGMMFSKLNVFHWHLTDSESFPFFFPSHPNFTKFGSFSSKQVYSEHDIKEIVNYAYVRGIRIIPELDSPAHLRSWSEAPEAAKLINCTTLRPPGSGAVGTPLGQINPTLNETYALLKDLFGDLDEYFPWEFFHLGNDEVDPYCWNNTEIYKFMEENHLQDFNGLFNYYINEERKVLNQTKTRVYWLNTVTAAYLKFLPGEILQWWGDTTPGFYSQFAKFPENKFILSNSDYFYLDIGFGKPYGLGGSMRTWLSIYNFPLNESEILQHEDQILGLEACEWTEMTNDAVVISRIFPRAASLGEKAWSQNSNPHTDNLSVFQRLNAWAVRSSARGVPSGPLSTGFCEINPSQCFNSSS